MPIATTLVPGTKNRQGRGFYVELLLTFTGSYATDGEVPSLAPAAYHPTNKLPSFVNIMSKGGHVYKWDNAAQKFLVFVATSTSGNIGLAQHSVAAYNAGVTSDVVVLQCWYMKTS